MADMLNKSDSGGKHKDNRPSEIQKSEKIVSTTMNAITNSLIYLMWMINHVSTAYHLGLLHTRAF